MPETHIWTLQYKLQTFFRPTYLTVEESDTKEHIANQGPKRDLTLSPSSLSKDEPHTTLLHLSDK